MYICASETNLTLKFSKCILSTISSYPVGKLSIGRPSLDKMMSVASSISSVVLEDTEVCIHGYTYGYDTGDTLCKHIPSSGKVM